MKALLLFLVALVIGVVIIIGGGLAFLCLINEERKNTCGKCDFCDEALNHCWMRGISVGTEDEACVTFQKRDDER